MTKCTKKDDREEFPQKERNMVTNNGTVFRNARTQTTRKTTWNVSRGILLGKEFLVFRSKEEIPKKREKLE
ncbi:hypothetical protein CDAR_509921 [Caerostris darwini]|uniref:Uncharacterized protein n=1 Tax=Caerostris darwini TaxID=1538125 RepID=A0AAV4TTX4_9ARAC|nr:hypothetical protein CDAR_509921 [Caerostris darwini]